MSKTTQSSKIPVSTTTTLTCSILHIPTHPPRPPCWQDFRKSKSTDSRVRNGSMSSTDTGHNKAKSTSSSTRKKHKPATSTASTAELQTALCNTTAAIRHTTFSSKTTPTDLYYRQGKLKRTRSESCISEQELPHLTLNSLDIASKSDCMEEATRRYLQDTYLKCSRWLSQISTPCGGSNSELSTAPVDNSMNTSCNNLAAFEDEFSSMEVSTEEDLIGDRKRYSLDRIPE